MPAWKQEQRWRRRPAGAAQPARGIVAAVWAKPGLCAAKRLRFSKRRRPGSLPDSTQAWLRLVLRSNKVCGRTPARIKDTEMDPPSLCFHTAAAQSASAWPPTRPFSACHSLHAGGLSVAVQVGVTKNGRRVTLDATRWHNRVHMPSGSRQSENLCSPPELGHACLLPLTLLPPLALRLCKGTDKLRKLDACVLQPASGCGGGAAAHGRTCARPTSWLSALHRLPRAMQATRHAWPANMQCTALTAGHCHDPASGAISIRWAAASPPVSGVSSSLGVFHQGSTTCTISW